MTVFANGFAEAGMEGALEKAGYKRVPIEPEVHNVYFTMPLAGPLPEHALPEGFSLRKMQGAGDLEAYQAATGFARVDPDHLRELVASEEYSHLVVPAPGGDFAAYCECSISRAEWALTGVRLGWIDYIETREAFQQQGLGSAVLAAALRQLQAWGAETAQLVTVSSNTPAVTLYRRLGFERLQIEEPARYRKDFLKPGNGQEGVQDA